MVSQEPELLPKPTDNSSEGIGLATAFIAARRGLTLAPGKSLEEMRPFINAR
jgi:hypothetical protein